MLRYILMGSVSWKEEKNDMQIMGHIHLTELSNAYVQKIRIILILRTRYFGRNEHVPRKPSFH